jgi:hypothetical protein
VPFVCVVFPYVLLVWFQLLPVSAFVPCTFVVLPYRWTLYEFPEESVQVLYASEPIQLALATKDANKKVIEMIDFFISKIPCVAPEQCV